MHQLRQTPARIQVILLYLAWTAGTWLCEGRIHLLRDPDTASRLIYALVVNIGIGTVAALAMIAVPDRRRWTALAAATVLGAGAFALSGPKTWDTAVLVNCFFQVLPTSIAEIVICWGTVAACRLHWAVGLIVSDLLFGVYHFAHSEPFNDPQMVLFLMFPGLFTGLVYAVGKDLWAALIFHNFMALIGVLKSVDVRPMATVNGWTLALSALAVAALVLFGRRSHGDEPVVPAASGSGQARNESGDRRRDQGP